MALIEAKQFNSRARSQFLGIVVKSILNLKQEHSNMLVLNEALISGAADRAAPPFRRLIVPACLPTTITT